MQLRAYVGMEVETLNITLDKTVDDSSFTPKVQVSFHNYGVSPALKIFVKSKIDILPYPIPNEYDPVYDNIDGENSSSAIFQGVAIKRYVYGKEFPSRARYMKNQKNDNNRLFVFVDITYEDVFGEKHHENFSSVLTSGWDEIFEFKPDYVAEWSSVPNRPDVIQ